MTDPRFAGEEPPYTVWDHLFLVLIGSLFLLGMVYILFS